MVDVMRGWRGVQHGVTPLTERDYKKYWLHWNLECIVILTAFAAQVRTDFYGKGCQVMLQTIAKALAEISKTIEMAEEPSLVYSWHEIYILPLECLIEGMR